MQDGNETNSQPLTGLPHLVASSVSSGDITSIDADTVVVNLFQGVTSPGGATGAVDRALGGTISELIEAGDITGKPGEVTVLYSGGAISARRVLVVGLGREEKFDLEAVRRAAARAALRARELGSERLATIAHGAGIGGLDAAQAAQATLEGALLASYSFGGWRREAQQAPQLEQIVLVESDVSRLGQIEAGARAAKATARGAALARDLVNLPGNVVNPAYLVDRAREVAQSTGMRFRHGDAAWAESEGLGAFLAVARGSRNEPAFIELEHNADRKDLPLLVLVGKGITFDSGGLSLKTQEGMVTMKGDMGGAAAVLGAMQTIAELDLPVRVLGLCACAENMPDGNAFRPSDVLVAGSGHSIEVISTDAEGRLALADALWYAQRFQPSAVIDIATLTGSSVVALGAGVAASLFSNDRGLTAGLEEAGAGTGERVWHMPLFDEYRKSIESKVADLKNTGGRQGGVGTAASFLEAFTDYPWAHIDMAGMEITRTGEGSPYIPHGGTGFGVRLLVSFVRQWGEANA
mgnify:FL=1